MGFWVVRKLVLREDGSVDISTAHFVAWSIRILGALMILQVFITNLIPYSNCQSMLSCFVESSC